MNTPILGPGSRLGEYVIEAVIGRGAFGVVYRARGRRAGAGPVALKVIAGRGDMERILIEPEILIRLHHPNVVRLFDYFVEGSALVLVMELVAGESLEEYVRARGRLAASEVRSLLTQLAGALDHAHRMGVLHRDIKLANVLVDQSGPSPRFVLADFGVARLAQGIQLHRRIGGTYHFMAPEQLRGRAVAQSDLWALGVVAYTAISGRLPFAGATLDELTRSVCYDTPLAPSRLGLEVSAELDDIVLRLLDKQLETRTASGADLAGMLGLAVSAERGDVDGGGRSTWERAAEKTVWWSWRLGIAAAFVACIPSGPISGLLQLVLGYMSLKAYRDRRGGGYFAIILALAPLLLLTGPIEHKVIASALVGSGQYSAQVVAFFWWLPWVAASAWLLFKAARVDRELALLRRVRSNAGAPEAMVEALWRLLELHPEDVTVHQRYVEALVSAGRLRDAVVEARLVLAADPYNLGVALLLGHAYFELGLFAPCIQLCDAHLSVVRYGFELTDLRQRAASLSNR